MELTGYLRIQAHANALSNHRLGVALAALGDAEWQAQRTSFFPSLALTLDHILAVDQFYVAALCRESGLRERYAAFVPCASATDWARRQRASDLRLVALCDALDASAVDAWVELPRRDHVQRDRAGHVLAHLFNHQTHHRGQVHAMLAGTAVAPPQLDEFMMPSEAHLRRDEMQALGWDEAAIYLAGPARA
ncbi:MAG: DinB family protein [Rubrivivax sp.]